MPQLKSAVDLENLRKNLITRRETTKTCVAICSGTGCHALGSQAVYEAFMKQLEQNGLQEKVSIRRTGCHGFCERGAIVTIFPQEVCYFKVKPDDVAEIVSTSLLDNQVVERLLFRSEDGKPIRHESEIPFYRYQKRLILENNRLVDPQNIEDYVALGGYKALSKAIFKLAPEQIINEVKKSGLRGRGGAGFPTGIKWETTQKAPGKVKYVIVNADEGDPGAYMDRSLLEGNPHSVLEGLVIGAYAIGAHRGFIYVRQEYPLAVENARLALQQAREFGLLGRNILGSGFEFDVEIHQGAGAFVSGESSALMTAIEGRVGEPRSKYTRTAVSGLWDRPSNLNNVKTWATIPLIINNGAEWFSSMGTEGSSGTMIFSLVGKVKNTGLVEVPMGTSLREIIFTIGGGISGNKKFKAVQTGGPSGGVIPESLLDTPVDYDELSKLGSMMGSGGMIAMDEDTCMVDMARYFLQFLTEESCGKCVPCREGISQMLNILKRICQGRGEEGDIERLEEIAAVVGGFSLCALGTSAPNPVLSSIRYFREEYEAHIKEKRCPAGVCKPLIAYQIQADKCQGCGICLRNCPAKAISGVKGGLHQIDQAKCVKCGACLEECPSRFAAISKVSALKVLEGVK